MALSLFVNDSLKKAVLKRQNRQYFVNLKKNELTNSELSFETKLKRVVATDFCGFV